MKSKNSTATMKKTTQENDFFSHFDNVEFVDIPTDSANKWLMSKERINTLYGLDKSSYDDYRWEDRT